MNDGERIELRRSEAHDCVVPGCETRARFAFIAAEDGNLAGHQWRHGDLIDLCPEHASAVYQGVDPEPVG